MPVYDGELTLQFVHPAQLHEVWPQIRGMVQSLIDKTGERQLPEDIYTDIRAGASRLFLFVRAGVITGYAVMRPEGQRLHIWHLYARDSDWIPLLDDHIEQIARAEGANHITFNSPRRGWAKRLEQIGFRPRTITYFREVQP